MPTRRGRRAAAAELDNGDRTVLVNPNWRVTLGGTGAHGAGRAIRGLKALRSTHASSWSGC